MISVHTEITDNSVDVALYDGSCAFCTAWARRSERILRKRGVRFVPLQEPAEEIKLVMRTGKIVGGATAMVHLARRVWWAWPVWAVSRLPFVMRLLDHSYRRIAARRYCLNGGCRWK